VATNRAGASAAPQTDVVTAWVVPLVVEAVGVLALCYIGIGAIMATGGNDLLAIAVAHGLAFGLLVAAGGHLSGGMYNPALTLGLFIGGRLRWDKAIGYVIAQLVGGVVGALLIKATFPAGQVDAANLGVPAVGASASAGRAVLAEIVTTFFLMYVVFGAAVDGRGPRIIAPLAIGLTLTMDILAVGPISGAAMNPARWFGPAVVQASFDNWWVYWVGPAIGAAIAAVLYAYIYLSGREQG
jgi:aquaporin Z